MPPALRLSQLRHGGRTWTAVPPLDLPIVAGADHVWTADPSIGLYARAATPDALEDAVGAALARLWDSVMLERWELLPDGDIALLLSLVERFEVRDSRPRPVEVRGYDPACAPTCIGGNGCDCGRIA